MKTEAGEKPASLGERGVWDVFSDQAWDTLVSLVRHCLWLLPLVQQPTMFAPAAVMLT